MNPTASAETAKTQGAYVHFPWCERRCPYCDFATRAEEPQKIPQERYTNAVVGEVETRRAAGQLDAPLHSVFFGGGTPSLWAPAQLARVIDALAPPSHVERTIECNPHSLDDAAIDALLEAGINRLSIGVQSLHDTHLRFLGRLHDRKRALEAVRAATSKCARVSADLIFGMPEHAWEQLREDVDTLLELGVEHVSTYALTIEAGTQFGLRHKKGLLTISSDDHYADLYERLADHLETLGFEHYEVSNFAKRGAESVHNLAYWQSKPYLGIGAAAVGAIDQGKSRRRYKNRIASEQYMRELETDVSLQEMSEEDETLDALTRCREAIMLGLRTRDGVDVTAVQTETGIDIVSSFREVIDKLVDEERLKLTNGRLHVPRNHWFRLDSIVLRFF